MSIKFSSKPIRSVSFYFFCSSVEYLGVMAWAAQFQWIPDQNTPADMVEMRLGRTFSLDTCGYAPRGLWQQLNCFLLITYVEK